MSDFLCYGCMKDKGYEQVCPYCGYINATNELPFSLREQRILKGRFLVGKMLKTGREYITYLGYDQSLLQSVLILEYFPEKQVERDARYTTNVTVKDNQQELYGQKRELFLEEGVTLTKQAGLSNLESAYQIFEENNTAYIIMEYNEKNMSFVPLSRYKQSLWDKVSKRHKRMSAVLGTILTIALLLILIQRSTEMPELTGLHINKAVELLKNAGIPYEIAYVFSADDSPDKTIYQEIPAGKVLKKEDYPVKITANKAVTVPYVVGREIKDAIDLLKKAGLNYIVTESKDAAYKPGVITNQIPAAGNHPVKDNFTIEIFNNLEVEMPDVSGMQFADAEKLLKDFNIEFTFEYTFLEDTPGNRVLKQEPQPGTQVLNTNKSVILRVNTAAILPSLSKKEEEEIKDILYYTGYRKSNIILLHSYIGMPGEFIYEQFDEGQIVGTGTGINIYQITDGELYFPDPLLYDFVQKTAGKSKMTAIWALGVEELRYDGSNTDKISNIDGIQYFKNMHTLRLRNHRIMKLDPLIYTTGIQHLDLSGNSIRFIKSYVMIKTEQAYMNVLAGMKQLKSLNLSDNFITHLDGFESLSSLETLILDGNKIKDLSPLAGCTSLKTLSLVDVPVEDYTILKSLPGLERLEIDGDGDYDDLSLIS